MHSRGKNRFQWSESIAGSNNSNNVEEIKNNELSKDFKEEEMGAAMILDDPQQLQSRPRHASSSSDGTVESSEIMDANEVGGAEDEVTADDLDISTIQPALMLNKKQNNIKNNNQTPKDVFFFYQSSGKFQFIFTKKKKNLKQTNI